MVFNSKDIVDSAGDGGGETPLTGTPEIERKLRLILEKSPYLIAYINKDLVVEYANPRVCDYWKLSPNEIVGRRIEEVVGGPRLEQIKIDLVQLNRGETVSYELVTDSSGTRRIMEIQYTPSFDEQQNFVGYFAFANDATKLRESERRQQLILDSLPSSVFLIDRDEKVQFCNKKALQISELQLPSLVGIKVVDLLQPSGYAVAKPHLDAAFAGESRVYENRYVNRGGQRIDVEVHLSPEVDEAGDVIGVLVMSFEITARNQATQKLRETEERFQLAVRGSRAGVWELDPARPDYLMCQHIENVLGLPIGSLKDSRSEADRLIHPDDLPRVLKLRQEYSHQKDYSVEFRVQTGDSGWRWFRSAVHPIFDEQGQLKRILGTLYDIDELKKAELHAAEQVRRRDSFLAMLSHELRNPLTAVTHSAFYLETVPDQTPVAKNMIDIINRQSRQMARLLDDLLDVSRITHGRLVFNKSVIDFSNVIREVSEDLQKVLEQRDQTFECEFTTEQIPIFGDAGRLHQALANLLENASKYTPHGGVVSMSSWIKDGKGWISIKDNGLGILAEDIENIFELFYQEEQVGIGAKAGLGVGLFLVKQTLDRHDGEIVATSAGKNKGSEFLISIPLCIDSIDPAPDTPEHKFQNLKLSLVEDHEDSRQLLALALQDRGFEVQQYPDGESAIEGIISNQPTIAIIDIGLPNIDGLDVARQLRQSSLGENILLIALTGFGRETDRQTVLEAGFDFHLVKPINVKQLCGFIAEHV